MLFGVGTFTGLEGAAAGAAAASSSDKSSTFKSCPALRTAESIGFKTRGSGLGFNCVSNLILGDLLCAQVRAGAVSHGMPAHNSKRSWFWLVLDAQRLTQGLAASMNAECGDAVCLAMLLESSYIRFGI